MFIEIKFDFLVFFLIMLKEFMKVCDEFRKVVYKRSFLDRVWRLGKVFNVMYI